MVTVVRARGMNVTTCEFASLGFLSGYKQHFDFQCR
jgi:hypothetical protein